MFPEGEVRRNLLGCFETVLLMRQARTRFGTTAPEAIRSFAIPVMISPLFLLAFFLFQVPETSEASRYTIALLYALRMVTVWGMFLGLVWWIAREIDREQHFFQFVIANNWLSIPATLLLLPVLYLMFKGTMTWEEAYPYMSMLMVYAYVFTAYMASWVLRIPLELGGFITFISYIVNTHTLDAFQWLSHKLAY